MANTFTDMALKWKAIFRPGKVIKVFTWSPQERSGYEKQLDWFHKAKFGIFFHYLSGGKWMPEECITFYPKKD